MEFEKSALWREVQQITQQEQPVHGYWTAEIHTAVETIPGMKVLSVDEIEDFLEDFSTITVLRMAVSAGVFATKVYPYKSQLEITLYRNSIGEVTTDTDFDAPRQSERYVATLYDRGSPMLDTRGQMPPTATMLDLTSIEICDFQLVSKSVEQLRMLSIGSKYRTSTAEDLIRGLIASEARRLELDGTRIPDKVTMVPPSNTTVREHFDIPQPTRLVDLPAVIQSKCGGIYSTGLAYFLKDDGWFFWGAFDTTRFDTTDYTLTVLVVPSNKLPGSERTYRLDGTNLVVMVTGDTKFKDDSEVMQLNYGNGVRAGDATTVLGNFATVSDNKAVASRGASTNEFVGQQRPNGNNNVQAAAMSITANTYELSSELARRQGSHFDFLWENSNPRLLRPGMPVRVLYLEGTEIKTVDGVGIRNASYVETVGPGLLSTRHRQNTRLTVFVNNKLD